MEYYIYALTDSDGKPFYVGKTNNPSRRRTRHVYDAINLEKNLPVHNKIRKLLREGSEIDIVVQERGLTEQDVDQREQFWISDYRRRGEKIYNVANGGEGGKGITAEIIEKIRQANIGRVCSEETKRKISIANKGKTFTTQHKDKLSKARKQRIVTPETRTKTSQTSTGKINIKEYELISPDGSVHITTTGLADFCRQHNLTPANLHKVLKGEREHHKGWKIHDRIDT